jgi:hypothetical protein
MDVAHITRPFERMGARVELFDFLREPRRIAVNIVRDGKGQKFSISAGRDVRVIVPQVQPDRRHLLLVCKLEGPRATHAYLCGHDEREWFAAAVPNRQGVSDVRTAMEALMPPEVRHEAAVRGVAGRTVGSRRTAAYRRQGEWFFIPREDLQVPAALVRRNEMLQRGNGTPHFAEFGYRVGGEPVYAHQEYRHGLWVSAEEHARVLEQHPRFRRLSWRSARANMRLHVKGRIRHPDHATIDLWCWHLVVVNTEHSAPGMAHLRFVD